MQSKDLRIRTKKFALDIVLFCRNLPADREGMVIGGQLLRAGTSVAANYRAARRARSKREFLAKLGIVEEKADEALFWLELLEAMDISKTDSLAKLKAEGEEILSIIVASIKTARKKTSG